MSSPSDKAVEHFTRTVDEFAKMSVFRGGDVDKRLLEVAHDPALGLERSVCLRDVVEALRSRTDFSTSGGEADACQAAADFIEREFGS